MTFMTSPEATRLIRHGHSCLGVAGPAGLTLTAGGHNDSLLWSRNPASGSGQLHTWSPWGTVRLKTTCLALTVSAVTR
ncbi:hypothetical protein ACFQUX_29550 [Pantoea stewartii]